VVQARQAFDRTGLTARALPESMDWSDEVFHTMIDECRSPEAP
jgi:hypothetical protein